jgi:hypothetical protein
LVYIDAYGASPDSALLGAIERAQERMGELIAAAPDGVGRDAALDQNRRERNWLTANGSQQIA